jgi:serine/threonine-protein kinase
MLAILDDASRRFREDPEVWYRLAQARWRDGWAVGVGGSKILEAYDRAIALDSAFAPAYVEPMDIVMRERGPEAMRRHLRAYLHLSPTGTQGDAARLALRLLDPRQARSPKLEQTLDTVSSAALFWALQPLLWWSDSAETAVRVARRLAARSDDPAVSASAARLFYARELAWRGHVKEAYGVLPRGISAGLLGELGLLGGIPADSAAASFGRQLARPVWPATRVDVALPWWASVGDTVSLARLQERGDSLARSGRGRQAVAHGTYLAAAAAAYLALAKRDSATALTRLLTLPDTVTQNSLGDMDRFTTIRLLIASKRYADARARLARETRSRLSALDALMLLARAQVADHFGERAAATALYSEVVAVWGRADPHLQPAVTEARAALRRLQGS